MASAMRKMAVYLGLVEEDRRYQDKYDSYEEYDEYDEPEDAIEAAPVRPDYGGYASDHRVEPAPPQQAQQAQQAQQVELARITTLHPRTYNEARTIGEYFREGTPVIMNLTEMVDSDARRLVDFAAGLIFGLRGSIDKVTNKVFLLSPANIEVTAEDKARIAERGFFNQS
jgi:cell division inhibitor SepF